PSIPTLSLHDALPISCVGAGADQAAALAERALCAGRLLEEGVRSPPLFTAGVVLGLAGRTEVAERLFGEIADRADRDGSLAVFSDRKSTRLNSSHLVI